MKTGIIILAAGNSTRLGEPKQLLEYHGKSLINNVIEQARAITNTVIVVTGFDHISIKKEITCTEVVFAYNSSWQKGMGSSISVGIHKVINDFTEIDNVIISVCDQPFICSSIFSELISKYKESYKGIVASAYSQTIGTPVLFDRKYFDDLSMLSGSEGAKKLFNRFTEDIMSIQFEKGSVDIDTKSDYEELIKQNDISKRS